MSVLAKKQPNFIPPSRIRSIVLQLLALQAPIQVVFECDEGLIALSGSELHMLYGYILASILAVNYFTQFPSNLKSMPFGF